MARPGILLPVVAWQSQVAAIQLWLACAHFAHTVPSRSMLKASRDCSAQDKMNVSSPG